MPSHAAALNGWRRLDTNDHVRQVLHNDHFSQAWERHPLLMGLPLTNMPVAGAMISEPEGETWFRGAVQIALGFSRIVEWLRGRLPGYPRLLVPHLSSNSVRCQESGYFFGQGFPWWRTFRAEAPQLKNRVDLAPFSMSEQEAKHLGDVVAELARAITATDEIQAFRTIRSELTDADRRALRASIRAFSDAAIPEAVDRVEPDNMMRRHSFAEAVLLETIEKTEGQVRDYLHAFERVDALVSAIARVIQELVVFGPPHPALDVEAGDWIAERYGYRVRLTMDSDASMAYGLRLVEVRSEVVALSGVVLTDSQTVNIGMQMGTFAATISGTLLPGSLGALRSGPAG